MASTSTVEWHDTASQYICSAFSIIPLYLGFHLVLGAPDSLLSYPDSPEFNQLLDNPFFISSFLPLLGYAFISIGLLFVVGATSSQRTRAKFTAAVSAIFAFAAWSVPYDYMRPPAASPTQRSLLYTIIIAVIYTAIAGGGAVVAGKGMAATVATEGGPYGHGGGDAEFTAEPAAAPAGTD